MEKKLNASQEARSEHEDHSETRSDAMTPIEHVVDTAEHAAAEDNYDHEFAALAPGDVVTDTTTRECVIVVAVQGPHYSHLQSVEVL